jgi:hypothetical protein
VRNRTLAAFGATIVILGTTAGVASATTSSTAWHRGPSVYSTQVVGPTLPLTSRNTVVLTSPVLPSGNFLVTFDVTLLLTPQTNVDCFLDVNGSRIDGMAGAAGVGTSSFSPVYASNTESYVIHISKPSSHVEVICSQGGSPSTGSTTGNVRMLTAMKVGHWTLRSH